MRHPMVVGICAAAGMACGSAWGADSAKPLQPAAPPTGASLQIYIKVRNQNLMEFCKAEGQGVPRCKPGVLFEAKDTCAPPYKVAAVSCSLDEPAFAPHLVMNGPNVDQAGGACVWDFAGLIAAKAPLATTTLLCMK